MILSIVIPVYNEEKTIKTVLEKIREVKLPPNISKEIIVVDDNSSDKTTKILTNWRYTKIKYIRHDKNLGKGAAVRSGIKEAKGDFIIIQDADLEYNPDYYNKLLKPILRKQAKVVYGTRLISYPLRLWGRDKTILPLHLLANRFLSSLTNLLYGSHLTDMETGFKLFKSNILKDISIKSSKFDFEAEITAKIIKKGFEVIEVPVSVIPRTYNQGKKIGWTDGIIAIWTLLKYRFVD